MRRRQGRRECRSKYAHIFTEDIRYAARYGLISYASMGIAILEAELERPKPNTHSDSSTYICGGRLCRARHVISVRGI